MSANAPWFAMSADWWQSPMFDGLGPGPMLVWPILIACAKSAGRGGQFSLRRRAVTKVAPVTDEDINAMLVAAERDGAIERDGDNITLTNWRRYQHRTGGLGTGGASKDGAAGFAETGQTSQPSTKHQAPSTKHQAPVRSAKNPAKRQGSSPTTAIAWTPESGWTGITEADREAWAEAYPACDIGRQLAAMTAWLLANPAKAPRKRYRRFIVSWLSRSQDRGGDVASNGRASGTRQPTYAERLEQAQREQEARLAAEDDA